MGYGKLRACSALVMLLLLATGCSREFTVAVSPFEIEVVDEQGDPVEGALVLASYRTSYGSHNVVDGVLHAVEQRTDERGVAEFQGWRKRTKRGFGWREPTITVIKFGWLTHYDGTKSERDKEHGVYKVWQIRPAIQDPVKLKSCKSLDGSLNERCMLDAYSRLNMGQGPMKEVQTLSLPEFAKEGAKHEAFRKETMQ